MRRPCATPDCKRLSIEDGARCEECTTKLLRDTRGYIVPEWVRRARSREMLPKVMA